MNIKPNLEGASFDVVAVLDPLSLGNDPLCLFTFFICFILYQAATSLATVASMPSKRLGE